MKPVMTYNSEKMFCPFIINNLNNNNYVSNLDLYYREETSLMTRDFHYFPLLPKRLRKWTFCSSNKADSCQSKNGKLIFFIIQNWSVWKLFTTQIYTHQLLDNWPFKQFSKCISWSNDFVPSAKHNWEFIGPTHSLWVSTGEFFLLTAYYYALNLLNLRSFLEVATMLGFWSLSQSCKLIPAVQCPVTDNHTDHVAILSNTVFYFRSVL